MVSGLKIYAHDDKIYMSHNSTYFPNNVPHLAHELNSNQPPSICMTQDGARTGPCQTLGPNLPAIASGVQQPNPTEDCAHGKDGLGDSDAALVGCAIAQVLNQRFPTYLVSDHFTHGATNEYRVENVLLEQVILRRHMSEWPPGHNRDPDVEQCLIAPGSLPDYSLKRRLRDVSSDSGCAVKAQKVGAAFGDMPRRPRLLVTAPSVACNHPSLPLKPSLATDKAGTSPITGSGQPSKSLKKKEREKRRRENQLSDPWRKTEEFTSNGRLNALSFRVSSTGWQGTNYNATKEGKMLKEEWLDNSILRHLTDFTKAPYENLKTRIRDSQGRLWLLRTFVGDDEKRLLPAFEEQARIFVSKVEGGRTGFTKSDMQENARGPHWFSICGHDRNYKSEPSLSAWHTSNRNAIDELWISGGAMFHLNALMNSIFEREFPLLAKRYRACAEALGITPLYGLFYSFCLNAALPEDGVGRVHCSPHIDWKNLAIGICVIFVYGTFNSKERSWLVIWEAGVVIEMPAGVFVMYPSSLFYHFNVDMCDLQFVATNNGELPTPNNCSHLDGRDGRGSCVWFNQASLFQTAELGFATVAAAKKANASSTCDSASLIHKGLFPVA